MKHQINSFPSNSCRVAKSKTPHGGTCDDPENIKTNYSEEVIAILNDVWVKEYLERCHKVRSELGLNTISDLELIISVLKNYEQKKIRFISRRLKRGLEKTYFRKKWGTNGNWIYSWSRKQNCND